MNISSRKIWRSTSKVCLGVNVLGPAGTIAEAMRVIQGASEINAATLDINIRGERIYGVADVLRQRCIPFIFTSGYESELDASAYANVRRCIKPLDFAALEKALTAELAGQKSLK